MKKITNFITQNIVTLFLAILFFGSLLFCFPNASLLMIKAIIIITLIMIAIPLIPLIYFLFLTYKFVIPLVFFSILIYQLKTKKYDEKINPIINEIRKYKNKFFLENLSVCSGSILIYFGILGLKGKIPISQKSFLNWELLEYFFLFLIIYSLINSIQRTSLANNPFNHFWYGLLQILNLSVLLLGFFSLIFYIIFQLSKVFLSNKDAFELSKWMIGLIGLGLGSFNIKLFVDYFRGAKVNAPYSLEQLQQLQILQQMQSNLEASTPSEKKLSQEKIMSEEDIKSQIEHVKDSGKL